jgi:3D (Asp-Asp-Asp) domain-containing protein/peptidoglycan hydrolase CwlO-like protein
VNAPLRNVASVALVVATVSTGAAVIPASGGAQASRAVELRGSEASLAARSRSAVLELYALDSRLVAARTRLAALRSRAAAVERERVAVRARLAIARSTLQTAERLLAGRLRALYERGEADPLAVVLGAQSLEDAVTALDGLAFAAEQDRAIIERTGVARSRLVRLSSSLRARGAELARLAASAAAELAELGRARSARAAYVARLADQRRLTADRIAEVEAAAASARARTPAAVVPEPFVARGARTLTVSASGYALTGGTATGISAGWGVAAVDPSYIPLGTRFTVPGYGEAVASDTGSAIRGAEIDLWFPSVAAARTWGRRTVTITLD